MTPGATYTGLMLAPWLLALLALAYVGVLFGIAWWGDRAAAEGRVTPTFIWVYALALAVHCTSWAYYGTVGQSASLGWFIPPTYVGVIALFVLGPSLIAKLIRVSRRERISSVADFVAARYGRDRTVAVAVTLIATFGVIPYIALQLKAIDLSFHALAAPRTADFASGETSIYVAAVLAAFAILFGARQVDATQHRPGMMLALAFGSLFKLVAFIAVGVFVTFGLFDGFADLSRQAAAVPGLAAARESLAAPEHYAALAVLGFFAIFCLPWQFHVGVVESGGPRDLRLARWVFPAYLLLISVFILPIANAGLVLGAGEADLFVLSLPLGAGADPLALFAFLGGLAAATGMVIVAAIALATMLCNEVAMPLLLRSSGRLRASADLSGVLLAVRRSAIVLLLLFAWLYHRWIAQNDALAAIGEIALAAAALLGPAMLAGLYWRRASRFGALTSLVLGFIAWSWTLLLPTLAQAGLAPTALVDAGPMAVAWLRPTGMFGLDGMNVLAHGLLVSLGAATAGLIAGSLLSRRSLVERIQSAAFVDAEPSAQARLAAQDGRGLTLRELQALTERFVGARRAAAHFAELARGVDGGTRASTDQLEATQRLLASAVGASSAQRLIEAALVGRQLPIEDVVSLVDGASQALEFSQELLQTTLENVSQGVSVVDAERRIVAWNRRYLELYRYPPGLVRVGRPVVDLLRYNAERGELGPGDPEELVTRRLAHLERGTAYTFQRERPNGMVLEIRGNPIPGGGFVTSYSDVTEYKRAELALKIANETLEQRVRERTRELSAINAELRLAKSEAERANLSKTRFLAAAGHDLLQPLNAAGLFAGALGQKLSTDAQRLLLVDLEGCLANAEGLLSDLLDISKLDAGVIRGVPEDFQVAELLEDLDREFRMQAAARGLRLAVRRTRLAAHSDRKLLRRVLQNFLSNALRYTSSGGVVVGARRAGPKLRLEVWDSGGGIAPEQQRRVFDEFVRGSGGRPARDTEGFGLGLAIAERIARVLSHRIGVRSIPGRGSVFWIEVGRAPEIAQAAAPVLLPRPAGGLEGVKVVCVDNDPSALRGIASLLEAWGCRVRACRGVDEALAAASWSPDLLVLDYHLDDGVTGLDLLQRLRTEAGVDVPVLLVSADASERLREQAESAACVLLRKPLKPLQVRSALRRLLEFPLPSREAR